MTPTLAELTTLRVGGPVRRLVEAGTEAQLLSAVQDADAAGEPLLVLGSGSNVLAPDEGFAGTVLRVSTSGVLVDSADACGGVVLDVAAGEPWDDLVARAAAEGWSGLEAMSGIPGRTGATPLQNVGAYGQEVGDTLAGVRTYDRARRAVRTFAVADLGLGYRTSRFRGDDRFVVLTVRFQLRPGSLSAPVRYGELAASLGVAVGERAPLAEVRAAVLALRRGKGMVLDPADRDTWSAGSFFTNPVLPPSDVPAGAPAWPQPDGRVKTSAAWLIERAGFPRGHAGPGGRAALSGKHTLALSNRGGATSADLLALAREVRDGVRRAYGVELRPEPVLLGTTL